MPKSVGLLFMKYTKPHLSIEKQVEVFISRGLLVPNKLFAESVIRRVGYYRFSAYCLTFQKIKDQFDKDVYFEDVYSLYLFDCELRCLIFKAISLVEVAFRARFSDFLAERFGLFGYVAPKNFDKNFRHEKWLTSIEEELNRSKELFVSHYKKKYHGSKHFPIWMASEVFLFSTISFGFSGLIYSDQKKIAKDFGVSHTVLHSWLHSLVYVRNVCAHHSRIWNRTLAIQPTLPQDLLWKDPFTPNEKRIGVILLILHYLTKRIGGDDTFKNDVIALIDRSASLKVDNLIGLPEEWKKHKVFIL